MHTLWLNTLLSVLLSLENAALAAAAAPGDRRYAPAPSAGAEAARPPATAPGQGDARGTSGRVFLDQVFSARVRRESRLMVFSGYDCFSEAGPR